MTIHQFKFQLDNIIQSTSSCSPSALEGTWEYFKEALREGLNENYCEQITFVAGMDTYFDGQEQQFNEDLFKIFFGRVIDAEEPSSWRVADIGCYFLYDMNEELRLLDKELRAAEHQIEDAFCRHDDKESVRQKMTTFFAFVDENRNLWNTVSGLTPTKIDIQFWID